MVRRSQQFYHQSVLFLSFPCQVRANNPRSAGWGPACSPYTASCRWKQGNKQKEVMWSEMKWMWVILFLRWVSSACSFQMRMALCGSPHCVCVFWGSWVKLVVKNRTEKNTWVDAIEKLFNLCNATLLLTPPYNPTPVHTHWSLKPAHHQRPQWLNKVSSLSSNPPRVKEEI